MDEGSSTSKPIQSAAVVNALSSPIILAPAYVEASTNAYGLGKPAEFDIYPRVLLILDTSRQPCPRNAY